MSLDLRKAQQQDDTREAYKRRPLHSPSPFPHTPSTQTDPLANTSLRQPTRSRSAPSSASHINCHPSHNNSHHTLPPPPIMRSAFITTATLLVASSVSAAPIPDTMDPYSVGRPNSAANFNVHGPGPQTSLLINGVPVNGGGPTTATTPEATHPDKVSQLQQDIYHSRA